jgi:hypothetical protein
LGGGLPMWFYNGEYIDNPGDYVGFVYLITNQINNRKYIGKKNFYFSKTRQVKGKKKRYKVESDWQDYYGSNKELATDVEKLGKENFKREILKLCTTKGEFSYFEAKYQFQYDVLLHPNEWYNGWISCRVRSSHLRHLLPET